MVPEADIVVRSRTTTYGLAGAASGSSHAEFTTSDLVTLDATQAEGLEATRIYAGGSPFGDASIGVTADTRLYNRTVVPVSTIPSSNAIARTTRKIDVLSGSRIASAMT